MEHNDSELIQRTLDGDQTAFAMLVEKYQKGIHALAWRKIGDFHIAQEIAQDAFLRAYERLSTLKDHNLFPGWVYVITSHLCTEWHRKKRYPIQSLEKMDIAEIDQVSHSQYMVEKRDDETAETLREVVHKLLQKLPESERTVMTLHYLGEMTCDTISKMIGVSPNTVKSRLNRARNRLKKEESMLRENLSSFQLPSSVTENIMKRVSRTRPVVPSSNKPLIPLAVSVTSAILVFLLLGFGIQHFFYFSPPYDINSESELMVEIIDAPVNRTHSIRLDKRNQPGNTNIPSKNLGVIDKADTPESTNPIDVLPTHEIESPLLAQQWTQLDSPESVKVTTLFATKTNDLYAMSPIGLYRMTSDNEKWHLVNNSLPTSETTTPIVEHNGTLYIPTDDTILSSEDKGKTWKSHITHPKGDAIGLIVKENVKGSIEFYLGLLQGIFFSDDAGVSWTRLNSGLGRRKIYAINSTGNVLFAGTDRGLFRLNLATKESWEQLPVAESKCIHAFAGSEDRLYIVAGLLRISGDIKLMEAIKIAFSRKPLWAVFKSTDGGDSWTDITPKNDFEKNERRPNLTIAAADKSVMLIGEDTLRSNDAGATWVAVDKATPSVNSIGQGAVAVLKDKHGKQIYVGYEDGIRRSTDEGDSWKNFNIGLGGTIQNLTVFNSNLYAVANDRLIISRNGGYSWKTIPIISEDMNLNFLNKKIPLTEEHLQRVAQIKQIAADKLLYARGLTALQITFFRLDEQNEVLIPIQNVPTLGEKDLISTFMETMKTSVEDSGTNNSSLQESFLSMGADIFGTFAISGNTFYVEHKRKLLICDASSQEDNDKSWYDTKIEDTRNFASLSSFNSFKLAVIGSTVYVGKPDGVLLHSVDRGYSWETVSLPISVETFNQIHITDKAVYVATDKAVLYSDDGIKWNTITDSGGQQLIFDRFVMDGPILYAVSSSKSEHGGVYRLTNTNEIWERITPEIPDAATSIAIANSTLYVGTENRGLQRIELTDSSQSSLTKY